MTGSSSRSCYCIALRAASRRLTALYDAALQPAGINVAQFSLLRNVERAQPVSLTELGRRMELDRSTVGRNVRLLQRMGLVRMTPGSDQREASVGLEPAGREILSQAIPVWQGVQDRIQAQLGEEAAGQLRDLLARL